MKWKRGVALVIDSMFGGGGSSPPPTANDSLGGKGNSPGGSFSSGGLNGEASASCSISPPVSRSVLWEFVGGLLEPTKPLQAVLNNPLMSFVGSVGSVGGCFNSLCLFPLDPPTFATAPTMAQVLAQTEFETVESASTTIQQNLEANQEVEWLMQLLADLEFESQLHPRFESSDQLLQLFNEAEQKLKQYRELVVQQCANYEERLVTALGEVLEILSSVEGSTTMVEVSQQQPNFTQLQALLLACQTLTDLKVLKKQYKQRVSEAYKALSQEQQLIVDSISAVAVPHQVFKYTGQTIERDSQKLATGALVFVDPHAKVNKTVGYVSVWLLRSLELGWQKALSVSRNSLILVEKAIAVNPEIVESQQTSFLG